MNIFVLDLDHSTNATYHVDRHIVKMPLESAQLICTALHTKGISTKYKPTHINHPCSIFTRYCKDSFLWVVNYGMSLCEEYTYRYKKIHACQKVIEEVSSLYYLFDNIPMCDFALAMPDNCKIGDAVESYREYYRKEKQHLFNWKNRERPNWL